MSLLVTGSLGVDTLETPFGTRADVIGGSAVYFSFAARLFTPVRLVGVVGEDVPQELLKVFEGYPIDTAGLEIRKGSKTFRWHGSYVQNMNEAVTVGVQLNVLAEQGPRIPPQFCDSRFVFLATVGWLPSVSWSAGWSCEARNRCQAGPTGMTVAPSSWPIDS